MTQNATQAKKSRSFTVGVSFQLSPIITLCQNLSLVKYIYVAGK